MLNNENEKWKLMTMFDGNDKYEISTKGRIRNIKTGRILKTSLNKNGKPQVNLSINGKYKTRTVESIFCKEFFGFTVPTCYTYETGKCKLVEYRNGNYEDINEYNLILPYKH